MRASTALWWLNGACCRSGWSVFLLFIFSVRPLFLVVALYFYIDDAAGFFSTHVCNGRYFTRASTSTEAASIYPLVHSTMESRMDLCYHAHAHAHAHARTPVRACMRRSDCCVLIWFWFVAVALVSWFILQPPNFGATDMYLTVNLIMLSCIHITSRARATRANNAIDARRLWRTRGISSGLSCCSSSSSSSKASRPKRHPKDKRTATPGGAVPVRRRRREPTG